MTEPSAERNDGHGICSTWRKRRSLGGDGERDEKEGGGGDGDAPGSESASSSTLLLPSEAKERRLGRGGERDDEGVAATRGGESGGGE